MASLQEVNSAIGSVLEDLSGTVTALSKLSSGGFPWWIRWLESKTPVILKTPPGTGKTFLTTELVNRLFEQHGLATLTLVLAHDAAQVVPGRENWNHWYGHSKICDQGKAVESSLDKGYRLPQVICDCDYQAQFTVDRPTIAPLDYLFGQNLVRLRGGILPEDVPPIRKEIEKFPLRIVDEINFSRFIGNMTAKMRDVKRVGETHPESTIRSLCRYLHATAKQLEMSGNKDWCGPRLYESLDDVLRKDNFSLPELLTQLENVQHQLTEYPWIKGKDIAALPTNFPPYLVPILIWEIRQQLERKDFNPRIHLHNDDSGTLLKVFWRKFGIHQIPTIFLDATVEPNLLGRVFGPFGSQETLSISMGLPDNVSVYQWIDDTVTMTTLGLYPHDKGRNSREVWYDRLAADLIPYDRNIAVGLVTHKAIEEEVKQEVRNLGFTNVKSLYYGKLRSSNRLKDVKVLILFGCPIPSPDAFLEEAQAFFYDDEPFGIDSAYSKRPESLVLKSGGEITVKVGGYYSDSRLQDYFKQKCQYELYQAIHRCRPLRTKPNQKQSILVYTNIPIPEVPVDNALGWLGRYAERLRLLMTESEACSVPHLARLVRQDDKFNTVEISIRRHPKELAELAGVEWDSSARRFRTRG